MKTETGVTFDALNLAAPILRALAEKNYTHPSPIQARSIPALLEGRDMMGCAQTGTGKTAAFSLPILHRLNATPKPRVPKSPRVLILAPTRELAGQIGDNIATYGKHLPIRHLVIFGGVGEHPQIKGLAQGIDILVATPGRLLDLMNQGHARLDKVEVFVLDEADRMLDMGFAPDVKRVLAKLPAKRQSLLFSATMPAAIRDLASGLLHNPVHVEVTPVSSTAERIEQRVCHVEKTDKNKLLLHLLSEHSQGLVLVFTRTKHGANRLSEQMDKTGIPSAAIHGNKSQGARQRALEGFRSGAIRVLIATDIAARGIDVKGITLVINFDIPNEPEAYVHRIGRTARAGAEGLALSFCDPSERAYLRDIQRLIRQTIPVQEHPHALTGNEPERAPEPQGRQARQGFRGPKSASRPPNQNRSASPHHGSPKPGSRFRFGRFSRSSGRSTS
jgi:ATP-dependent RNA helicase RhlE